MTRLYVLKLNSLSIKCLLNYNLIPISLSEVISSAQINYCGNVTIAIISFLGKSFKICLLTIFVLIVFRIDNFNYLITAFRCL